MRRKCLSGVFASGFLSLLVGNLDDPKVLARCLEDTSGWETFL